MKLRHLFYLSALLVAFGFQNLFAQTIITAAGNGTGGYSGDAGAATSAELNGPYGVATDGGGNLYIVDQGNSCVRKVNTSGTISTIAGNGSAGYSGDGGPGTASELNNPSGVACDASGNVYIADQNNNCIRKVSSSGVISTFAGNGTAGYSGDGSQATAAELNQPINVATDNAGNVFIVDFANSVIRKINSSGIISTVAGTGTPGFSGDGGSATLAKLYRPTMMACDAFGNLYIVDENNDRIRMVNTSGVINTIAGTGTDGFSGDGGPATTAELNEVFGVCTDACGNVYIADLVNERIRSVNASGIINTICGTGTRGATGDGGPATAAELYNPYGICMDGSGNLFIADNINNKCRKIIGVSSYISGSNAVCVGASVTLTDPVSGGAWSSSNSSVATVGSTGIVNGVAAGTAIISYSASGCPATMVVTVSAAPSSGSITGGSNVCIGSVLSLTDATGGGTWNSSNTSIGSVSGSGGVTGIAAGTTIISYTVSGSCGTTTTTTPVTVNSNPAITIAATTNVSCFGMNTGSINTITTGGTPGYSYLWSPGSSTSSTLTSATAGTYSVTVTDAHGCTSQNSATITQPGAALAVTAATVSDATCFGAANGSVHANTPSGGTYPYSYLWSPGSATTQDVSGLAANTYSVTVTDAHGCTASGATIVTQPSAVTASASAGTISCHGGTTTVTITGSGGTGGLTLASSTLGHTGTFSGSLAISGVGAGTYYFTVADANSCSVSFSITISDPAALTASSTSGSILCNGGTTSVTVTGAGGTGALTGTGAFTGVSAGSHTYTVTDANGCTATTTIVISEPAALSASATSGTILCHGGTTTVTVSGSGGTGSYTGTGTFTGVAAGTHSYTITDANGCTATTSITITEPSVLSAASTAGTISCHGGTTTVTVSATGGTGSYAGTGAITGVIAGTHTYTVTDANGCTATTTITISEPAALTASATSGTISCHGGTTTVNVSATGGTGAITGTGTFTGVSAGSNTYTVTDANGCTATTSITITEPSAVTATATAGTIACHGGSTTVTVTGTGGTGTITGTGSFTATAGTHSYTVTDANGCTATTSVTITEPAVLSTTASTVTNVMCFGSNEGSVHTSTPTGGTYPYTFNWNPGSHPTQDVTGLTANTYTVTVTDANGCTATSATTVTQPAALVATVSSGSSILCHGGTTSVTVAATGGTLGYSLIASSLSSTGAFTGSVNFTGVYAGTYNFTVEDANDCDASTSITITEPSALTAASTAGTISCHGGTTSVTVTAAGGTGAITGTGTFTGVSAGSHTYTVTDANGCTATTTIVITEPAALSASATSGTILCHGGTTTVTVSGSGGTGSYIGTGTFTGVAAGTHSYTITDANGCSATTSITITEPSVLTASSSAGTISCHGGTTTVTVSGTGGTGSYTGTGTFTGVSAGSHTYTVTDANGCTATTTITISEPAALTASSTSGTISCHGGATTVNVSASGGTGTITGTGTFTGVGAGSHTYTVTDANGCTATTTITISEPTALTVTATAGTILWYGGTTTVTVTGSGGTGTITGTGTFTGVTAGTHTYTITDANGCTAATTITITEPAVLSVTASTVSNVSCYGLSNGSVHAGTPTGGTSPYTFLWSPGSATTQDVTGLSANTYTVTVTDVNGVTATSTTTVTQPTVVTATATAGTIACNGGATTVTISGSGGTGGLTLVSSTLGHTGPFTGSMSITGVSAGTYYFTVGDVNSCNVSFPITISQPTLVTASATAGTISCHGGTTTVTVNGAGGTGTLTGTGTFTGVSAGSHTYTVTDANGCSATTTIVISEPAALTASATSGTILCHGGTTTVTVSGSGGTGSYSGTGTFTGVAAGTHSYTITDANGCSATTSITITEPATLTASSTAGTINCHGGTTTVTVSGSGGTGSYTGTGAITGVMAGTHTYTVTDANGCTATTTITISEPTAITVSATSGTISCHGGATTVNVSASGGTGTITGTGTFTGVGAGLHSYTVTDASGCTATASISITEPAALTATATPGTISCHGGTTTVTVTGTGGTGTITGIGTFTVTAGPHSYTITDANGCTATTSVTVTQPATLSVTASTATDVTCYGLSNGSVHANTPIGGTSPFSYSWTPGSATTEDVSGLSANTYTVTVTDAHGCVARGETTVTQPTAFTAVAAGNILCHGELATINISGSGGTGGYTLISSTLGHTGPFSGTLAITGVSAGTYYFTVGDVNSCNVSITKIITDPTQVTASSTSGNILCNGGSTSVTVTGTGGTGTLTGTGTFSGVIAGTHTYTVTDANSCSATTTITLTQPSAITASSTSGTILCHGGTTSVTVTASGGTGTLSGTGTFTGVTAGTHVYTVTDANGCTATTTITISEPSMLLATSGAPAILCNDGTTTVTVGGFGGTGTITGTGNFTGVTAGTYTYTITDANGCTANTSLTIANPALLTDSATAGTILCNGNTTTVLVKGYGGTGTLTGTGDYNVGAGTYNYVVTDSNGCTATTSVTITQPSALIASSSAAPILCHGGTTTAIVTGTGGTGPIVGTGTFTGITAGTIVYNIMDSNSCLATTTLTVTQPSALTVSATAGTILCHGGTTTVVVAATGGTGAISGTGTFTGIGAGTYNYTVTDANGCSASATITITQPTLTASASAGTISCHGGTTSVLVSGTGGPGPMTGTGTFTADAGSHTYNIADANGCPASVTVNISQPTAVTAASSAGDILCNGGTTSVTVTGSGGTGSLTGTGTFTGVPAGAHSYTVTDSNGCSTTTSITITQPSALTASASAGTILCNGGTTSVTVTGTGGTGPLSGTGTFTGIGTGTDTYTVTDGNGCTTSASVTIPQPPLLTASSSAGTILCYGGTTTVTVMGTGGTGTLVNTGNYTVGAGTHNYTINDANGCTANTSINVPQPLQLTASASATPNPVCAGSAMALSGLVTGGTTPYVTYSWQNPGGEVISSAIDTSIIAVLTGTYSVTVTDYNGCVTTAATPVVVDALPVPTVSSTGAQQCLGATGTYTTETGKSNYSWTVSGTSGVDYNITSGGTSSDNNVAINWLTTGNKTVSVNYDNASGCQASSPTIFHVTVNPLPVPSIIASEGPEASLDETVTYTTDGDMTGYLWSISGVNGTDYVINSGGTATDNSVTITWLTAGTRTVSINYNNLVGCSASIPSTLNVPVSPTPLPYFGALPPATICVGSEVTYTTQSGSGEHNYVWSVTGVPGTDYVIIAGGLSSTDSSVTIEWLTVGDETVSVGYTSLSGHVYSPVNETTVVDPLFIVSDFSTAAGNSCAGSGTTVTINSSTLENGTYTITYNLAGANTNTGLTAVLVLSGHTGTFTIPGIYVLNAGSNTITVASVENSFGCIKTPGTGTTAGFATYSQPASINLVGDGVLCSAHPMTISDSTLTGTWSSSDPSIATIASVSSSPVAQAVITAVSLGTSTITYTVGSSCSITANVTVAASCTDDGERTGGGGPGVTPNPSTGTFYITGPFGSPRDEQTEILVFDLSGQVVFSSQVTTKSGTINAKIVLDNSLANGMYFLRIQSPVESKLFHIMLTR